MGSGYRILLWDGWGDGLVMINPRFWSEGVDSHGNARNWWPLDMVRPEDRPRVEMELAEKHDIDRAHWRVIWD